MNCLPTCSVRLWAAAIVDQGVILPGYTHLQRAQPVLANHYWLAYCEKFQRDRDRLCDCRHRVNQLPLGTAALAGTTISIDRQMVANELGFEGLVPIASTAQAIAISPSNLPLCWLWWPSI